MREWYKAEIAEPKWRLSSDENGLGNGCDGFESRELFLRTYLQAPNYKAYDDLLLRHLPAAGRIFSIGSGRGINECALIERGYDVLGSDLKPLCVDAARRLFPAYRCLRLDAFRDEFPPGPFNAVISVAFLYQASPPNFDLIFRKVRRVLAPGGRLIFDVNAVPDGWLGMAIHDFLLPLETKFRCAIVNARRPPGTSKSFVRWVQHGYRYSNADVLSLAAPYGFRLQGVTPLSFTGEITRFVTYQQAAAALPSQLRRFALFRAVRSILFRAAPTTRMFVFEV